MIICQLPSYEKYLFSVTDDDQDLGKVLRQSQMDFERAEELRRQEEEDLQKAINESLRPSASTTQKLKISAPIIGEFLKIYCFSKNIYLEFRTYIFLNN